MSRSKRKTLIASWAGTSKSSEKWDKRKANRALRRRMKMALLLDKPLFPLLREVSSVYTMNKDGKVWIGGSTQLEWLQKLYTRLMRK